MNRLLVACGAIAAMAMASPALAQPSQDAAILANRLTGTELIVTVPGGAELGRGGIVSTAVDTCRLDLMWTGGADLSVDLGALDLLYGDGQDTIGLSAAGEGQTHMDFIVGADRYEAALAAFDSLARTCGSRPSQPARIIAAPQG